MAKKLLGIVMGILVLTLVDGTPPAYALFGSIKKMGTAFKNGATNTASSVNHEVTSTANSALSHSNTAQNAKNRTVQADKQAKTMVGGLADVFNQIT